MKHPSKGNLLIAEPSITGDISFSRSVILLVDKTTYGSVGFILNKPLDFGLTEIVPEIQIDFPVYNGGPVEQDNLYFIHSSPHKIPGSIQISEGLYWGGDIEIVIQMINNKTIDQSDIKFMLGYSGWDENQLENELKSSVWILEVNTKNADLFDVEHHTIWKNKMLSFGDEFKIWAHSPSNPSLN